MKVKEVDVKLNCACDEIFEKTKNKTLHSRTTAKTPKDVLDNLGKWK